jgi:hypothetical protein
MALKSTDLLYVSRGGDGYKMPAEQLIDFIADAEGSLTYRGTVDCTNAVGTQLDPNPPISGDIYINTGDGDVDTTGSDKTDAWVGINAANTKIQPGQRIVFDGTNWAIVGAESGGGLTGIGQTDPITVDNTVPAVPVIGISEATDSAHGSVQLADAPPTPTGNLVSTNTTDVLSVPHFNELASRITTAAGGGIQSVTGTLPIEVTTDAGTKAATVSIKDASTSQKGATTLQDNVTFGTTEATKATTPKAVADYAVPIDLSKLGNLP